MDDLISRKQALDAFGLSEKTRKYGGDHSGYDPMMLYEIQDVIEGLPSVNPQASNEDIHREREQAYMKGYEDASKRYRTEPCEDAISRSEAIRIASGYCHWTNILAELAKLPSVNPIQCEDAISRQEAIDTICNTLDEIDHVPQWVFDRLTDCLNELPSINPKPCGDAINIQAVLDMIDNAQIITDGEFRGYCTEDIDINILPSVSTEKTGRWEWVQYDSNPNIGNWHCSKCGTIIPHMPEETDNTPIYKWCPMCGTKMEVEE